MIRTLFFLFFSLFIQQTFADITVATGSTSQRTGNGSLTLTTPSSTVAGNVLIAQIVAKSAATVTAPSGWTKITSASTSSSGLQQNIYALNLGSSAPASSYSWTISGNSGNRTAGVLYTVIGSNTVNCGSADTSNCGGSTSATAYWVSAPAVSLSYPAGSLRMALFGLNNGSSSLNLNTGYNGKTATTGPGINTGGASAGVTLGGMYYIRAQYDPATTGYDGLSASPNIADMSIGSTLILTPASQVCFSDSFDRTNLGASWTTATRNVTFTPLISNNRLRLTSNNTGLAAAATLLKLIPASSNKAVITFRYYGYPNYNTSGADGVGIVLSDASKTPFPGQPGGALGYAAGTSGSDGFAGGWLGIGLDEYGNFANQNIAGPCVSGVTCATSAVAESVSVRGSAPNYYWLRGTGSLISPVWSWGGWYWSGTGVSNNAGHRYRITIDTSTAGKAYLTVERDTSGGTNYATLLSAFDVMPYSGQSTPPANFMLSLTGSTGASTNIHEIDDFSVCAAQLNDVTTVDHIELSVSGTPLTCTPSTVTVKACANASCSELVNDAATTVALSASNGGVLADSALTFIGSTSTTLNKRVLGTTTLGASSSNTTGATTCTQDGVTVSGCTYAFADAGLLLTAPTLTAGKSDTMTVAAVRASDNALQCVPAFANVSRSVKFWSSYSNPSTGTLPVKLGSSSTAISINSTALPGSSTTGTALTLAFNANGQASVPIQYDDAGQVLLNARYDGSASNAPTPDASLVMVGSSTLTSIPHGLCVDSTDTNWTCSAADTSCNTFKKAGETFNLRVTSKAYSSTTTDVCAMPTTPNYRQNDIALASTVVAPSGGSNGSLGTGTISITSGGTATISQTQSEVGVFKFTATPATGAYFSQTVPAGTSANFGRFIPAGFTLASGTLIDRRAINTGATETCSSPFTYLGEGVGLGFTLSAVNTAGNVTSNYTGGFARLALTSTGLNFGAQNSSTLLNTRLSTSCTSNVCGTWSNGVAAIAATATVARATAPDGPFTATKFGVKAIDADGVTFQSPDYNWSLSGSNDGKLIGSTILRYGRMRMSNAYGSALLPLPITTLAQYWNGSAFVTNTDDSCTPLSAPVVSSSAIDTVLCSGGIKLYGNLSSVTASVSSPIKSGVAGLKLAKPSYTSTSNLYLDLALSVPDYLKYDWNGTDQNISSCTNASDGDKHDDNPRARIRFGAKTNNSIIYLREIY